MDLNEGAEPYHTRPFIILWVQLETLNMEAECLCQLEVLKKVNHSQWNAPTFIIPKKDGTVQNISNFCELNKRIRIQPYPIRHIQVTLLNLDGFQNDTSLELNMGYYHLQLGAESQKIWTIVLPFGIYTYQWIHMGLWNSPKLKGKEEADWWTRLCSSVHQWYSGAKQGWLQWPPIKTQKSIPDYNKQDSKSMISLFVPNLEYLGYWITREEIQLMNEKVAPIMWIAEQV